MKKTVFFVSLFCIGLIGIFFSCSSSDESIMDKEQDFSEVIKEYGLQPMNSSDFADTKILAEVTSPEQLREILSKFNVTEEKTIKMRSYTVPRIKTRREGSGQNTAVISGSNSDGSASVHVDLNTPSVITSTYHLGIMDAFVAYTHISGSASRDEDNIFFSANGEGVVKLIWKDVELYKFNASIEGHCDSNGSNGVLTKF